MALRSPPLSGKDSEARRKSEKEGLSEQVFVTTCESFCATSVSACLPSPQSTTVFSDVVSTDDRKVKLSDLVEVPYQDGPKELTWNTETPPWHKDCESDGRAVLVRQRTTVGRGHALRRNTQRFELHKSKTDVHVQVVLRVFRRASVQRRASEDVTHSCLAIFDAPRYDKHPETSEIFVAIC